MSTEKSPTDSGEIPGSGRRPAWLRERRLPVVAVTAAVLLAGSGSAYWASTGDPSGQGAAGDPPPLTLDGAGARQAGAQHSGTGGVAPGEPAGPVEYRAGGDLPDGPDTAAVHRPAGEVQRARVAALAGALDVPNEPVQKGDRWTAGPSGGDAGPSLTVSGGDWTYTRGGGAEAAGSGGEPLPEKEAANAVRPALEALGLSGAEVDASRKVSSLRQVDAAPEVAGLPTQDWDSTFSVDADGTVVRGHGNLKKLAEGATYPVMNADETLRQLNKQRTRSRQGGCAGTDRPQTKPEGEANGSAVAVHPCGTGASTAQDGQDRPGEKQRPGSVRDAVFGLVTHYSQGDPVLVPSWIYSVEQPGDDGHISRVAHPAVAPAHLEPSGGGSGRNSGDGQPGEGGTAGEPQPGLPEQSAPAQPPEPDEASGGSAPAQAVDSYRAEGRSLKLIFWAGVCDDYEASAEETGESVEVRIRAEKPDSQKVCVKMAKRQTVEVELDKALGDREVVDMRDGEPLPRGK